MLNEDVYHAIQLLILNVADFTTKNLYCLLHQTLHSKLNINVSLYCICSLWYFDYSVNITKAMKKYNFLKPFLYLFCWLYDSCFIYILYQQKVHVNKNKMFSFYIYILYNCKHKRLTAVLINILFTFWVSV